jgi:hypothetical protein
LTSVDVQLISCIKATSILLNKSMVELELTGQKPAQSFQL